MTNPINELIQMRADDATSIAADILEKVATSQEWRDVVSKGHKEYGNIFTAFLLVPPIRDRAPEHLVDLCGQVFVVEGRDEEDATEVLLDINGWNDERIAANRQIGFTDLLDWDETALREALNARYWFVRTYDGCYVFDGARLANERDRS